MRYGFSRFFSPLDSRVDIRVLCYCRSSGTHAGSCMPAGLRWMDGFKTTLRRASIRPRQCRFFLRGKTTQYRKRPSQSNLAAKLSGAKKIMAWTSGPHFLGFIVSGDLAGTTIYTDEQGRKIHYPLAPPLAPDSKLQAYQHARFKSAMVRWRFVPQSVRANLTLCCRRLSLVMNATSLWCHLCLSSTPASRATMSHQAHVPLPNPADIRVG